MANLKNITELPVAESADGLNLIVNDNGAAKQISASVIKGKVKTVNNIEPDANGNIQIDTASSWNDLKDKPFYEEEVIEVYLDTEFTVINRDFAYIDVSNIPWEYGSYLYVMLDGDEYYCPCFYDGEDCMAVYIPIRNYNTEEINGYRSLPKLALEGGYISFNPIDFEEDRKFTDGNPHTLKVYNKISTVHKLDAKYLPDPFQVEEKKTLVVEGVPTDSGSYNVQSQLEVGKEYTYFIDGIEYTGECYKDDIDITVGLDPAGEEYNGGFSAYVYEYGIHLSDSEFDFSVSHKIELVERVYHTHHDFMIIAEFYPGTDKSKAKVVAGDFKTAKAKILKGLPATAYVQSITHVEEVGQIYYNFVDEVMLMQAQGNELCGLLRVGAPIFPDNTMLDLPDNILPL